MHCGVSGAAGDGARSGACAPALAAAGFALTAVVGGCATSGPTAEPLAPPPALTLGPVIPLLEIPPTTDRVRAVSAKDGRVHVLVASNGPRTVWEIVVAPSGAVEHHRQVTTEVSVSSLDAAFDRQSQLHALVDQQHLVFEQGVWRKSPRTPWEGLEVSAASARFVANRPG